MPIYTTNYTINSFDANTAKISVSVEYTVDSQLVDVRDFRITLPVDELGNVPTGRALDDFINSRITRETTVVPTQWSIPVSGVTNANVILDATDLIEAYSGIPILIIPAGPGASIIIPAYGDASIPTVDIERSSLPTPNDIVPGTYILDNGNVDGGTMTSIRSLSDSGAFVNDIAVAFDPTTVPQGIIDLYPYVHRDVLPEGADFNDYLSYFYVTHTPITIADSYAIGVFRY